MADLESGTKKTWLSILKQCSTSVSNWWEISAAHIVGMSASQQFPCKDIRLQRNMHAVNTEWEESFPIPVPPEGLFRLVRYLLLKDKGCISI